jgi:hypothetical protein
MARRNDDEHFAPRRRSRAKTPEERESMLVSMSMDRIEQQIADGTVSSQVLTHFAKLGSSRERLEQERLRRENDVLRKKVETMEAAVDVKNLMEDALAAFRGYSGGQGGFDDEDDYYD